MVTRQDYTVELERVFRGPMDLLLHLVKDQEVEIQDVEIGRVIEGYFTYLDTLEELDLEIAGDFLVMAATLMSIKARSLLPREEVTLEDELDPEDELIQRLIEYRHFKEASEDLEARWTSRAQTRERGVHAELAERESDRSYDLSEVTPWDLLGAFSRLMRETLANRPHKVCGERRPLRWYVHEVGRILKGARAISLGELLARLDEKPGREDLIGAFCALLELMKLGLVSARQEEQRGEIQLALREEALGAELDDVIRAATFMDEGGETLEASAPPAGAEPAPAEAPASVSDVYEFEEDDADDDFLRTMEERP